MVRDELGPWKLNKESQYFAEESEQQKDFVQRHKIFTNYKTIDILKIFLID